MEDYTKEDVIKQLLLLDRDSRKRHLVDQRSYLISILAYKFMLSEHKMASIINYKRDKINYNQRLALQYHTDKSYMQNIYVYSVMFPFELDVVDVMRINRSQRIELDLDRKFYLKLRAAGAILGHKDVRVTIKLFLEKSLKLWDE